MTQSMESNSEKETWEIGNRIAQQCEAGTIVLLHGDLGVGKTVFTKGFAAGLGVEEPVNSPPLRSYRFMKADVFRYIILMYIA